MTFDLPWGRLAAKTWGSSPPGVAGATVENAIEIHCELLLKDIDRSGQVPSSPRLAGQCWHMGQGDPQHQSRWRIPFQVAPLLTPSFHLVALDLPGHGRSAHLPPGNSQ